MAHVATTRSWATTSSQGNDTQPVDSQPAGGTRHHDHTFDTTTVVTTTVSSNVETRTATVLLTAARNSSEHEQGWLRDIRVVRTTFQNGPAIESSQPEIRKSITVHRVTLEQLTRVNVLVSYVYRRERIS